MRLGKWFWRILADLVWEQRQAESSEWFGIKRGEIMRKNEHLRQGVPEEELVRQPRDG